MSQMTSAAIWLKKSQKTGFFAPDKLENRTSDEKGEEK